MAALEKKAKPVEKVVPTAKEVSAKIQKASAPSPIKGEAAKTVVAAKESPAVLGGGLSSSTPPTEATAKAAPVAPEKQAVAPGTENPELRGALADWASGRAYLGTQGRGGVYAKPSPTYRLNADELGGKNRPAPWSKAVAQAYPDNTAFHDAAKAAFPSPQEALAYIDARDVSPRDEEILNTMLNAEDEKGQSKPNPFEHGVSPAEWRGLAKRGLVDTDTNGVSRKGIRAMDALDSARWAVKQRATKAARSSTPIENQPEGLVSGESGEFRPGALIDSVAGMADPLKKALKGFENERAMGDVAEGIQKGLVFTERAARAIDIKIGQGITNLVKEQGFKAEDGEAVRRNVESGAKLTPKQEELRDQYVLPLRDAGNKARQARKLIQTGKFSPEEVMAGAVSQADIDKYAPSDPNYLKRIPVNRPSMVDWAFGTKGKGGGGGGKLKQRTASDKHLVFQEAQGPTGEHEAVAIKKNRVTQFNKDADGNVTTQDLGAYRSGFVTTQEMAEKAVGPIDKELAKLDTEYKTLTATKGRTFASPGRIEGIQARIEQLNRQKAGILASVSPAYQQQFGMSDNDVLTARSEPVLDRIAKLEKQRAALQGQKPSPDMAAAQQKKLDRIEAQVAEAHDKLGAIEDEFSGRANEGRYWQDKNGNLWQFNRGSSDFISSRTGQQYHDNAILSSTIYYVEEQKALNAVLTLEHQKAMLSDAGLSMKTDNPKDVPEGWRTTSLPQMRGTYFPSYIADTYDQFAGMVGRGEPDVLERLNRFNLGVVLMNPWMHGKNVLGNWALGKVAEGTVTGRAFSPAAYARNARAAVRAVKAVVGLNKDYTDALENGVDLLRANRGFDGAQKALLTSLAKHFEENTEDRSLLAKAIGIPAGKVVQFIHDQNHGITFGMNDVAVLQSYFSTLERFKAMGLPNAEAAARDFAHNQTMEYRPFIRFLGHRKIEGMLEDAHLSAFWRYHSNIVRQGIQAVEDALGTGFHADEGAKEATGGDKARNQYGETKNVARARGASKLFWMILYATVGYKALDQLAKAITQNTRAVFPTGGLPGTAKSFAQLARGEKGAYDVVHSLFTPALATENLAQVISNVDFYKATKGYDAQIRKTGQPLKKQAGEFGAWMAGRTLPGQMAQTEKFSPGTIPWRLAGFTFPKGKKHRK